ncbi:hypothetical protein [Cerasicoccus frondis]|uniref:hypothetical protein n=1 Tax=Cerasicoccus frondis TaxID=490090 RepID=UPI002852D3BA|nr:hypothetical protein [Cerasicoccus frondis]
MKPPSKLPTKLPQQVIDAAALREEERFAEYSALLTRGKLMKRLTKQFHFKPHALRQFADVAQRTADIETSTESSGMLCQAKWVARHEEKPGEGDQLFMFFFGIFGILYSYVTRGDRTTEITFLSVHRMPAGVVNNFKKRRLKLAIGEALAQVIGVCSLFWTLAELIQLLDNVTPPQTKWAFLAPLILTIISFGAAWWCNREKIPPKLRLYGGGKFKLKSLQTLVMPDVTPR